MRVVFTGGVTLAVTLLLFSRSGDAPQGTPRNAPPRLPVSRPINPSASELTRFRTDVIQKTKETRAGAEKLLALQETERQQSADEYERRRELY